MHARAFLSGIVLFLAAAAAAQQRPIFDPDDFLDPRDHAGMAVFIPRLVMGVALNSINDYRPLKDDVGFIHIANSLYIKRYQFDYKHSEVRGKDESATYVCGCDPPIYFPTPPPPNATPAAPTPGAKDTVQAAGYYSVPSGSIEPPVMLRVRVSWSRQNLDTKLRDFSTNEIISRSSGREQSLGVDADTYVRIAGRGIYGSLVFARTSRSGTIDDREQNELTYTSRFPGVAVKDVLLRAMLTVGGVSDRGGTAINIVTPYLEAFWHHAGTRANLHVVYSPQSTRSGNGWETHHQIAIFVDRALFVKLFR
jgi:hypothetical protein